MHVYRSDVNFAASTVRVSHKPDRGWTPKAYKEREIPIPAKLVKSLKALKAKSDKTCGLVFPTAGCNPKLDFLDCLKACAEGAKLDEDDFWLHKFRATFFEEAEIPRTQKFVLRWSLDGGHSFREICAPAVEFQSPQLNT